jgi:quercetin dioxygenase-like cupin family protein
MPALKDATHLYGVESRSIYGERPGFKITELKISPSQRIPWHLHNHVQDTFYVIEGTIEIFLQHPKERVLLGARETYPCLPGRPHLVTNAGDTSALFLVIADSQGIGEYDFVPLTETGGRH